MSLEAVWDAVARQAGAVQGVKQAYGRQTGENVSAWPDDITDGPVALVDWAGSELLGSPPFEKWGHDFDITLWVPLGGGARGYGVALLAPMFERFVTAFRANTGLYGVLGGNGFVQVQGSSGLEDQTFGDVSDKEFVAVAIVLRAVEVRSVTASIGPSS